jgi:hypothetical protein
MANRTGIVLLLLGLPLAAGATADSTAQCAELANKFTSAPRTLSISELDELKTCISEQRLAMEQAQLERQVQANQ